MRNHVIWYHVPSCHVTSRHATPRHAMSCHISYPILSYHIISYTEIISCCCKEKDDLLVTPYGVMQLPPVGQIMRCCPVPPSIYPYVMRLKAMTSTAYHRANKDSSLKHNTRLASKCIATSKTDHNEPYHRQLRPLLLTWFIFNPRMDKQSLAQ